MREILDFIQKNPHTVGAIIVMAIFLSLLFNFGIIRTVIILIGLIVAFIIGALLDGNRKPLEWFKDMMRKLFQKKK